jgi:hypothetical protein
MSEGVCDMSTGIMYYERPVGGRQLRAPRGLPGAAVRAGRLLELWGYRAAAMSARADRLATPIRSREAVAERIGGPSSLMESRPRIY